MAGYTKGPWEVAYYDHNGQSVVSGAHTEVCTCWHHSVGSLERQMRANAALIAAAPCQHEAAAEIDRLSLVILSAVKVDQPAQYDAVVAALMASRAALAKARGAA